MFFYIEGVIIMDTYINYLKDERENHSENWDYYGIHQNKTIEDYFENPLKFIQSTFTYAAKETLISFKRELLSEARAAHSVSAYLFGSILAHTLFDDAFNEVKTEDGTSFDFSYIWTLTCLYHDYGYWQEQNKEKASDFSSSGEKREKLYQHIRYCPYYLGMHDFRKSEEIYYSIWQRSQFNSKRSESLLQDSIAKRIKDAYSKSSSNLYFSAQQYKIIFPYRNANIINRYFAYRLLESNCIDHGIAGGIIFFNRILKNYEYKYNHASINNSAVDLNCFICGNKLFSFNQLPIFAYVADCIMNHNIWRASQDSETAKIYSDYLLNDLIGENYKPIKLYDNPLLFIMAISDSLEPYKLLSTSSIDSIDYSFEELCNIFSKTSFEISKHTLTIEVPSDCADSLRAKLKEMENWIAVKFIENPNNCTNDSRKQFCLIFEE